MGQLKLTEGELLKIGFKKRRTEEDEDKFNFGRDYYDIKTLNGRFYYNPDQKDNVWYHQTIIGETSNHINLDVESKGSLFILLSCFRCKFNLIF